MSIEKEWLTASELFAVVIYDRDYSRCGYVAVEKDSILFGKEYSEPLDCITQEQVDKQSTDWMSPLVIFTAGLNSDGEGKIRRSLNIAIKVHQNISFSGHLKGYSKDLWFFGFDCWHVDDDPSIGGQSLEYCEAQCESMAAQLKEY